MKKTPTQLYQVRFDLAGCYFSSVPLSAPVSIDDNVRILSKGDQGDCWAAVAVEVNENEELIKKEGAADQAIAEIANLYALVSGFSIHYQNTGANGLKSLEDLGKPPSFYGVVSGRAIYPKERLEELQQKLMAKWELTKNLRTKVQERLRQKNGQFLRVALFYNYQSGLVPAIPVEEAFVDAAIGLEALFNEAPQDIAYKLASRGALLLSCSGEKENCFPTLKELYKLRNNIVHGTGETIDFQQLLKIRELLVKSIKACLALGLDRNKSDIIEFIDQALIEPNTRESLMKEIEGRSAELFR